MPAVRAFSEAALRARPRVDKSDAELSAIWTLSRGGSLHAAESRCVPHVRARSRRASSRATVGVLRLHGVAVPPVYGPTGDTTSVKL